jgi:hypothetical protein
MSRFSGHTAMQLGTTSSIKPEPVYLGRRWIQNAISEYRRGRGRLASLQGKRVIFPERDVAAAAMHLYVGTFTLDEIASVVSLPSAKLAFLRTQIDFMTLVDGIKASFARSFRENLILNEYAPLDYAYIASEYAALEELARNQIRVPLFKHMTKLGRSISEKERYQLPIDFYDLRTFKKLFSFFVFEECFLQALEKPSFPELRRIAKDIVWVKLEADYDELDSLLSMRHVRDKMRDELKARLGSLDLL